MILLGEGTVYVDGVEVGKTTSVTVQLESKTLADHFKSVRMNGEELISVDERK